MARRQVLVMQPARPPRKKRPKHGDIVRVPLPDVGEHPALVVGMDEVADLSGYLTILPISTVREEDRDNGLTVHVGVNDGGVTGVVLCHLPQTFPVKAVEYVCHSDEVTLQEAREKFAAFMGFGD